MLSEFCDSSSKIYDKYVKIKVSHTSHISHSPSKGSAKKKENKNTKFNYVNNSDYIHSPRVTKTNIKLSANNIKLNLNKSNLKFDKGFKYSNKLVNFIDNVNKLKNSSKNVVNATNASNVINKPNNSSDEFLYNQVTQKSSNNTISTSNKIIRQ